jgi:hypothetical protein
MRPVQLIGKKVFWKLLISMLVELKIPDLQVG